MPRVRVGMHAKKHAGLELCTSVWIIAGGREPCWVGNGWKDDASMGMSVCFDCRWEPCLVLGAWWMDGWVLGLGVSCLLVDGMDGSWVNACFMDGWDREKWRSGVCGFGFGFGSVDSVVCVIRMG